MQKLNDFTYRDEGTVILFTIHNDATRQWVEDNLDLESWQWVGANSFAIDRRPAIQLIEALREAEGFTVMEVR